MDAAVAGERVGGYAKTTGGLNGMDIGYDDLPGAGVNGEMRGQRIPSGTARQYSSAFAVQAHDEWCFIERAEHKGDTPVFQCMGRGFVATADEIHVRYQVRSQHFEAIQSFG